MPGPDARTRRSKLLAGFDCVIQRDATISFAYTGAMAVRRLQVRS